MIHDLWNGEAIKPLTQEGGFLTYPEYLGLSLSTDGVPVFKSSASSLWPVYLTIANLPPNIRTNNENTLLCGIWFGPKKPPINPLNTKLYIFPEGLVNASPTFFHLYLHFCQELAQET